MCAHRPSALTDHLGARQTDRSVTGGLQTRLQTDNRTICPFLTDHVAIFPRSLLQLTKKTRHTQGSHPAHIARSFACSPGPPGPWVGPGLTPLVTSASQACSRPPQGCGPRCGYQRCGYTRPTPQDGRSPYGLHPAPSPSSMRSSPCLPPPGLSCLRISPVSIPHCPTLHPGDPDHMTASHLSRHALLFIMICPILTPARDRDGRLKHWQQNMPVQCLPMGYPSQV